MLLTPPAGRPAGRVFGGGCGVSGGVWWWTCNNNNIPKDEIPEGRERGQSERCPGTPSLLFYRGSATVHDFFSGLLLPTKCIRVVGGAFGK